MDQSKCCASDIFIVSSENSIDNNIKSSRCKSKDDEENSNRNHSEEKPKRVNFVEIERQRKIEVINKTTVSKQPESNEDDGEKFSFAKMMKPPYRARFFTALSLILFLILVIITIVLVISSMEQRKHGKNYKIPQKLEEIKSVAMTSCGYVRGRVVGGRAVEYLGIPYALPPTGKHRFKPPKLPSNADECWDGELKAQFRAPLCPQEPIRNMPEIQYNEDCLTLDVMVPASKSMDRKSVVVYIPGQTLLGFTEFDMKYQPTGNLSAKWDVVFVVIRYRTGPLGFIALEELAKNSSLRVSGNYGLYDIITALTWIHHNIGKFNGDPDSVTVLGHGSSASLILSLMSSPKFNHKYSFMNNTVRKRVSRMLFHRAWLTGGSVNFPVKPLRQSYAENLEFLTNLKCSTLDCLYKSSTQEIIAAVPKAWKNRLFMKLPVENENYPTIIVQDGVMVRETPLEALKKNKMAKIPLVFGSIFHEYKASDAPVLKSWIDFSSLIWSTLNKVGNNIRDNVIQFYKKKKKSPMYQYHSIVSDLRVTCPIHDFASKYAEYYDNDQVYKYIILDEYSDKHEINNDVSGSHGIDVASIFHQLPNFLNKFSINSKWTLEEKLQKLFFNFVHGFPKKWELIPSNYLNILKNNGSILSTKDSYKSCNFWTRKGNMTSFGRTN